MAFHFFWHKSMDPAGLCTLSTALTGCSWARASDNNRGTFSSSLLSDDSDLWTCRIFRLHSVFRLAWLHLTLWNWTEQSFGKESVCGELPSVGQRSSPSGNALPTLPVALALSLVLIFHLIECKLRAGTALLAQACYQIINNFNVSMHC